MCHSQTVHRGRSPLGGAIPPELFQGLDPRTHHISLVGLQFHSLWGPRGLTPPGDDLRRERRLLRGLDLARVIEAVCSRYGVDRGQLAARDSRSQASAALAYLAKHHTEATRADLVPILGLSRPESVPNLSARFAALLQSESNARRDLMALERALGLSGENSKSV